MKKLIFFYFISDILKVCEPMRNEPLSVEALHQILALKHQEKVIAGQIKDLLNWDKADIFIAYFGDCNLKSHKSKIVEWRLSPLNYFPIP